MKNKENKHYTVGTASKSNRKKCRNRSKTNSPITDERPPTSMAWYRHFNKSGGLELLLKIL